MNRTIGLISTNYSLPGLGELAEKRAPASVPFGGRYRLIDFALSNMVNSHIHTVGVITPYYYRSVLDHVGAGKPWGLDRKDGGLFIMPGGAYGFKEEDSRFLLRDFIRNRAYFDLQDGDYVLVTGGTAVMNVDYLPLIEHQEISGAQVTLLCRKTPADYTRAGWYVSADDKGCVQSLQRGETGEYQFLESFIINKALLKRLMADYRARSQVDIMTILSELLADIRIDVQLFEGYVGFVDTLPEYMRVSRELLDGAVRRELFLGDRRIMTKIHDTPPAFYVPGANVKNAVMTAGSIVEGEVSDSIVFRNARIEKNAVVKNCVLLEKCTIREGAHLEYVICDKRVEVSPGTVIIGTPEHPCVLPRQETV